MPCDLPLVAQARPGAKFRFTFVTLEEGIRIELAARARWETLSELVQPLVRDVSELSDLLSMQLISGATAGDDLEREAL